MAQSAETMYTVPLRKELLKTPRNRKAKRAVSALRAFLLRATKADRVAISPALNEELWLQGIQKPPGMIRVKVAVENGVATARLPDEVVKKEGKKAAKESDSGKEGAVKTESPQKEEQKKAAREKGESGQKQEAKGMPSEKKGEGSHHPAETEKPAKTAEEQPAAGAHPQIAPQKKE